ncbi:phosphate/phosphite/phosphonate ABC transporter substrate-binding protein [Nostoc flagelliforme FACHB-838]|uniref:Phosphate/phosphite/phosphonate ABC transporter substrate-binding protein n=1 Tax=Nostoc flagelliforme FACHB-838 TaxID=2692904 RepID=A0ABR8DPG0_9NOSO|nr:phosphate/phosphite/phosphonate ABC transporter substrate-binding protein [Nostoc flagelliforme]MBD2531324.1 phosphate/phosphite/phosphonate ABC transporter substrate-binding protein [Nostoc flagelliforme FACHB-838]
MNKCLLVPRLVTRYCLFNKSRVLIVVVILALLSTGCTGKVSQKNQPIVDNVSSKQNLPTLKIGVLPTQSRTEQERMIKPLKEYLEQSLGQRGDTKSQSKIIGGQGRHKKPEIQKVEYAIASSVDFQIAKDYEQIIDWLLQDKLDMAYLGPMSYLEALDRGAKVEPLVAPIDKYTGQPWYRACIIVRQDSLIKTLKDLKGKRIAFVDKLSTSGYLMPLATFKKVGINYDRDFAKVLYTGSHSNSMAALENGIVDAVATNISSYLKRQKSGKLTPQNSRILWESAPIPSYPIVVSKRLAPELIQRLKQAFISSPEGFEDIIGTESAGYTLVSSSDYAPIEQLRKYLNLISVPAK